MHSSALMWGIGCTYQNYDFITSGGIKYIYCTYTYFT